MLKTLTNIAAMRRLATLAALFGAGLGANAATIANTFGPGDSFSSTSGLAIGKNPPSIGNSPVNNLGGSFTVTGSDYTFTGAEAALQYLGGVNTVTLGIRSDASGLRGALLEAFTVTNIPSASPGAIVSFNASAPLTLFAGTTYWLTSEEDGNTAAGWRVSGTSSTAVRLDQGAWTPRSASLAFRIDGDPISTAGPTAPEPGTLPLFALAAAGMFFYVSRRRKLSRARE